MEIDVSKCKYLDGFCTRCDTSCEEVSIDNCYYKQLQKYKNALDEIEECIKCCATTLYGCGNCKKGDECDGALSDLILQKIKEVKENE